MTAVGAGLLCVVFNKTDKKWVVEEWAKYQASPAEYRAPLEVQGEDDRHLMEFIVEQMNTKESSERFWLYNAHKKLPTGGRLAYARISYEMAKAKQRDIAEMGGSHVPSYRNSV